MKKILLLILGMQALHLVAQERFFCRDAAIKFTSKTSFENIEAVNNQGLFVIDLKTGKVECSVLLKSFNFSNALMQAHFNENYVESAKYPRAYFKGDIQSIPTISLDKNADYTLAIKGIMQLHGQLKEITTTAYLHIKDSKLTSDCVFDILLDEYAINVPKLVKDKIADRITISTKAIYQIQKTGL
jgi:hypothetical protein